MKHVLLTLLVAFSCPAQNRVADLEHADWQVRNRTARALAADGEVDIEAVLQVLSREWHGKLPEHIHWNSAVGMLANTVEPRSVVRNAGYERLFGRRGVGSVAFSDPRSVYQLEDLCCPLHPHELALFVLRQSKAHRPAVALNLDTPERAQAWLLLSKPDNVKLLYELLRNGQADAIVGGLWRNGASGRARLDDLLRTGPDRVQAAIVRLQRSEIMQSEQALDVACAQLANGVLASTRLAAARLLNRSDADVATRLAVLLKTVESRSARANVLAMLCVLGDRSVSVAEALGEFFDDSQRDRRFALFAASSFEVTGDKRGKLAERAFAKLSDRDFVTRALALDVIGRCGDGVDKEMRGALVALLRQPEFEDLQPRVLGCLSRLGAVPADYPLADMVACIGAPTATSDVLMAIALRGEAGGKELLQPLLDASWDFDTSAVLGRLATTAPKLMHRWLGSKDPAVRLLGLTALQQVDAEYITSAQLVELLDDGPLASRAVSWLAKRADAPRYAARVVAWLLAQDSDAPDESGLKFVAEVDLPAALKLSMLGPKLSQGRGWSAVRSLDAKLLRTDCRRWLAKAEDPRARLCLLGELCRLGLETDEDIQMVAEALSGDDVALVLYGLRDGPTLPAALRAPLRAIFDGDHEQFDEERWTASEVLWRHRAR